MKVNQLINHLNKYPADMEVMITYKAKINLYDHKRQKIGQVYQVQSKGLDKVIKRTNNEHLELINTCNYLSNKKTGKVRRNEKRIIYN